MGMGMGAGIPIRRELKVVTYRWNSIKPSLEWEVVFSFYGVESVSGSGETRTEALCRAWEALDATLDSLRGAGVQVALIVPPEAVL